jgi:hypothetical protein
MISSAGASSFGKLCAQITHSKNPLPDAPSIQPLVMVPAVVEVLLSLIVIPVLDIDDKVRPVTPLSENCRSLISCPTLLGLARLSVSVICN